MVPEHASLDSACSPWCAITWGRASTCHVWSQVYNCVSRMPFIAMNGNFYYGKVINWSLALFLRGAVLTDIVCPVNTHVCCLSVPSVLRGWSSRFYSSIPSFWEESGSPCFRTSTFTGRCRYALPGLQVKSSLDPVYKSFCIVFLGVRIMEDIVLIA